MAVFGPKLQFLKQRSATCGSRSRPPLLSFSLKICVIVLHTHRYHAPKFQPNPKHHDGVLILAHFARAACCCLLLAAAAAKPGRSTLDPKKGYKTKTGSTSSVTLTLTPPPPHPWLDAPLTPGQTPRPPAGTPPPPRPPAGPPPPNCPPPQVLTDSWGWVALGPVVVAPAW